MILYKYRDFDGNFGEKVLFNLEYYFSSTSDFNDPLEGSIPIEYDKNDLTFVNKYKKAKDLVDIYEPHLTAKEKHDKIIEALQQDWLNNKQFKKIRRLALKKEIAERFGIISFSKTPMNYLMWSHYSNKHTGYCIGFDMDILKKSIAAFPLVVKYQNAIPQFSLQEDIKVFTEKLLGTKSIEWKYEQEIRLVKMDSSKQTTTFPPEAIKEIYIGCKARNSHEDRVLKFVNKLQLECKVFRLDLDVELIQLKKRMI